MDRMLVVVFDNKDNAYQGSRVLRELDTDGSIVVYDAAIVAKKSNGKATVERGGEYGPFKTLAGGVVGGFIGLLAGPVGSVVGLVGGTMLGGLSDLENVRVGADFITDAANAIAPGKVALIAEIEEEEINPLDDRMEPLRGQIFRRSLRKIKRGQYEQDMATTKAEIAQSKADHAAAGSERRAKLAARIDVLKLRLQQKIDQAKTRREAIRGQAKAKLDTLKAKASQARGDIKARHEQRLAAAAKEYDQTVERLEEEPASDTVFL